MILRCRWTSFVLLALCIALPNAARSEEDVPLEAVASPIETTAYTPASEDLQDLIDKAISETGKRRLVTGVHTPWQIVHGILAYRWDFTLRNGKGPSEVNAIEWIAGGQMHDGMPLWEATPFGGRGHPFTKPYAFEGHPTQFMGYMTMANIPLDYEFQTPTKVITIRDIINDAKMQVRQGPEITWTLWAISHYEEPDAQWVNSAGEPWSIERLVKLQIDEPVTSGACGGTHGLFALSYARNMYLSTGKPLRGVWLEADQKIKRYILEAKTLQNSDGSFSANHFVGPGYSDDFAKRIATSGHQLEWLMIATPQSKLKEEWFQKAIRCIATDIINNRSVASDCGPLYHGVHALVVYRQRTVREYLVPKRNSSVKLTERKKGIPASEVSASQKKETEKQPASSVTTTTEGDVVKIQINEKKDKAEKPADKSDAAADKTDVAKKDVEKKDIEKKESDTQDVAKKAAETKDIAEKKDVEKKETEKAAKPADKTDATSEKADVAKKEAEPKVTEKKESEKKDTDKKDVEKKDADKKDVADKKEGEKKDEVKKETETKSADKKSDDKPAETKSAEKKADDKKDGEKKETAASEKDATQKK